jgi:hypothetical protein
MRVSAQAGQSSLGAVPAASPLDQVMRGGFATEFWKETSGCDEKSRQNTPLDMTGHSEKPSPNASHYLGYILTPCETEGDHDIQPGETDASQQAQACENGQVVTTTVDAADVEKSSALEVLRTRTKSRSSPERARICPGMDEEDILASQPQSPTWSLPPDPRPNWSGTLSAKRYSATEFSLTRAGTWSHSAQYGVREG